MGNCCECCLLMLWARATCAILTDQRVIRDVLRQRDRDPNKVSDKDFLRECAWAIYNSGVAFKTVEGKWDRIGEAFLGWDYQCISQNKNVARTDALQDGLRVRNSVRKVDAIISIAQWMNQTGWATIRKQLLNGLRQDEHGNFMPSDDLIPYLDDLPMIGETNARFIAQNLGYDLAKPDRWLKWLAAKFGYTEDAKGVQQFASDISKLVLERISVVDTVLWNACSSGANLSSKCPCCGKQR